MNYKMSIEGSLDDLMLIKAVCTRMELNTGNYISINTEKQWKNITAEKIGEVLVNFSNKDTVRKVQIEQLEEVIKREQYLPLIKFVRNYGNMTLIQAKAYVDKLLR